MLTVVIKVNGILTPYIREVKKMDHGTNKKGKIVMDENRLAGLRKYSEDQNKIVCESLQKALLLLMKGKPYESISITELCKKAGVSRMSFYGNFKTKDDILNRIITKLQFELVERIGSPFRQPVTLEWYQNLFLLIQEHADTIQPIFGAGFQKRYLDVVNGIALRHSDMATEEIYKRLLWNGAMLNITTYWLATDMQIPPAEMAQICRKYITSYNPETCVTGAQLIGGNYNF